MDIDKMSKIFFEEDKCEYLEGKLLVASPNLEDPYFSRSIIYICTHDEAGALGIIINQKIGMVSYNDFVFVNQKDESILNKNKKIPLMFGGPVNTDMLIALSMKYQKESLLIKQNFIVHTDIISFFKKYHSKNKNTEKFILAKGVSAWDSQQLEEEVESNDWLVIEADPELIFSQKRGDKWAGVIKKLGIVDPLGLVQYSGNC